MDQPPAKNKFRPFRPILSSERRTGESALCGALIGEITEPAPGRPRVRLTRAKLGKRAKLSRTKLASRRSGTRPTGPRQTRTRQKGRAKLE